MGELYEIGGTSVGSGRETGGVLEGRLEEEQKSETVGGDRSEGRNGPR